MRILAGLLALLLTACGKPALYQQESYVFGTRVVVSVWGVEEKQAGKAVGEVLAELDRLHAKLHAWRPSEVLSLNQAFAKSQSAPVDTELAGMLVQAADFARKSDQLFNPALGNLIALWGFHRDTFEPVTPDPAAVARLLAANPSMEDVRLENGRASSRNAEVAIDLGGFAKGWALDRVAAMLRARGVNNALLNIGGNVLVLGSKDGTAWKVGLQHPRQPGAMATITLQDGEAIGTSGDYQRYFESGGKRYSHLIDPRSGAPATGMQAATVIVSGKNAGTLSDVSTKSLFIGGRSTALDYARRFGTQNILLVDAEGVVYMTQTMQSRLEWLQKPVKIVAIE